MGSLPGLHLQPEVCTEGLVAPAPGAPGVHSSHVHTPAPLQTPFRGVALEGRPPCRLRVGGTPAARTLGRLGPEWAPGRETEPGFGSERRAGAATRGGDPGPGEGRRGASGAGLLLSDRLSGSLPAPSEASSGEPGPGQGAVPTLRGRTAWEARPPSGCGSEQSPRQNQRSLAVTWSSCVAQGAALSENGLGRGGQAPRQGRGGRVKISRGRAGLRQLPTLTLRKLAACFLEH